MNIFQTLKIKVFRYKSKVLLFLCIVLFTAACVEPYDFTIKKSKESLVVEGIISNMSHDSTLCYPSDGRYFDVKLSLASNVKNVKNKFVSGASVILVDNLGRSWEYREQRDESIYVLKDDKFHAIEGVEYKLQITISELGDFESDWVSMPNVKTGEIGEVTFEEKEKLQNLPSGEGLMNVRGINVKIRVPQNKNEGEKVYYLWDFDPTWIFIAPLPENGNRICWVSSEFYARKYIIYESPRGGYDHELMFLQTNGNERFLWRFSLLIRQNQLNRDFYEYLKELQLQAGESLSDRPPFNLISNIHQVEGNTLVSTSGYFSVTKESATRWYFSQRDLSYGLEDKYRKDCLDPLGLGGPICFSCMAYNHGVPSLTAPSWWED